MDWCNALVYIEKFCDLSKCREINLLHCSGDNLDRQQVFDAFNERLFIEPRMAGYEYVQNKKD